MTAYSLTDGKWKQYSKIEDTTGASDGAEPVRERVHCSITDVPVDVLVNEWENLITELSDKEARLTELKELQTGKEFDIVYKSDIDFKSLYGSTSEKVRKQHANDVLAELNDEINNLELSINWIKRYIPLIKEAVQVKKDEWEMHRLQQTIHSVQSNILKEQ